MNEVSKKIKKKIKLKIKSELEIGYKVRVWFGLKKL